MNEGGAEGRRRGKDGEKERRRITYVVARYVVSICNLYVGFALVGAPGELLAFTRDGVRGSWRDGPNGTVVRGIIEGTGIGDVTDTCDTKEAKRSRLCKLMIDRLKK